MQGLPAAGTVAAGQPGAARLGRGLLIAHPAPLGQRLQLLHHAQVLVQAQRAQRQARRRAVPARNPGI